MMRWNKHKNNWKNKTFRANKALYGRKNPNPYKRAFSPILTDSSPKPHRFWTTCHIILGGRVQRPPIPGKRTQIQLKRNKEERDHGSFKESGDYSMYLIKTGDECVKEIAHFFAERVDCEDSFLQKAPKNSSQHREETQRLRQPRWSDEWSENLLHKGKNTDREIMQSHSCP